MKKRITALLLCLVMVFSLIPTTVWAATADGVATQANSTGHKISVNVYKVVLDSSKPLGYQNPVLLDTVTVTCQDSTGHSGYNHSVNLKEFYPTNVGAATTDWSGWEFDSYYTKGKEQATFYNWTRSTVNATANVTGSEPYPCSKNFYLVYADTTPKTEDITLSYDANSGTGAPASESKTVTKGQSATFTVSNTVPTREGYTFKGWSTAKDGQVAYTGGNSITISKSTTLYAVWEENTPDPGPGPTPDNPGPGDKTPNRTNLVTVKCVTANANHDAKTYDVMETGLSSKDGDNYKYTVTLIRANYINKYSEELDVKHTDATSETNITLTWTWKNNQWVADFEVNPVIECKCKTEIEPPTDGPTDADVKAALGNVTVTVKCINPGTKHTSCAYGVLGGNDGYQLTKNEDGTYNVVLNAAPFVKAYSSGAQTQKQAHELVSAATLTWVLTFDKESGKWVGKPKEAGVDDIIQTAHRVPVHVVIYRNGDTSQAYADIALNSELPGTVIDLTKLKIGDYYQGDVEFYGWYNDGKWNEYTKDLAKPPAGLERITVNGWTNLKCMVYDLDKVVYFQSAEDLAAYQKDHSKNDGLLYTTTVRRGTTLPTADAPAATREGYTFQYWSREGQYQDVTGQTVSGWTNLYAAWTPNTDTPYKVEHYKQKLDGTYVKADTDELTGTTDTRATAVAKSYTGFTVDKTVEGTVESGIIAGDGSLVLKLYYTRNSYIISSDLRINGGDANLADGKTYAWTHRYGGKFEETIDYQPMLDALKARAMKVDAANEPYDAEIKLCFPKSEELFNEKILTYGQDGAFWNPGVKNTAYIWGHATTSYEVIFNTGDGSKVDTQIVKYGELATEPTTELKGYDFLGWFDADGNPFDFNNTEITHKTTLTAKWEKKTYIIASDLRINGGDANLADGKTYPWSYRYGGKFEETIDYTEMFDALKTRAMKVDEANGPVDSVVTLCFPGDYPATAKKLFNDTILTYGQDGGGWNPGNKNTAPIWGFATNVYAVTFNYKDDKTATATQNVEYGNMATEPQKVDRPGYRFLGWFTEDGKAFDFSTPITKSMTLTAKWEIVNINAYIIPITSDGTQLVGAGFDMALNTTTLGRVGLPGYEDEDAVRIHFATFASSAGLADAGDYFPGTDPLVVKAVADLKNGLERRFAAGVNEAKADGIMSKTNWTYLHVGELDDEDDTNFLSGNLVFYSARFVTEDSEHVTGMPNAEYTHNAVAVYDYYLDGETITIPDAVPERYGYDFLGWSVKAVPAENDKLLKAGDTVTVDGDVVFTAQWKLKEYTVSFDSKGGTKVDSQIVEHGSTATKPGNPHRNDYTSKGWYLDGKKFDFSTPITGDITLVARWATKTSGGSNGSSDTTTKDNGKTVQSGKTFDGGIALYVGLSVLSATGSALVITKKKRG